MIISGNSDHEVVANKPYLVICCLTQIEFVCYLVGCGPKDARLFLKTAQSIPRLDEKNTKRI